MFLVTWNHCPCFLQSQTLIIWCVSLNTCLFMIQHLGKHLWYSSAAALVDSFYHNTVSCLILITDQNRKKTDIRSNWVLVTSSNKNHHEWSWMLPLSKYTQAGMCLHTFKHPRLHGSWKEDQCCINIFIKIISQITTQYMAHQVWHKLISNSGICPWHLYLHLTERRARAEGS